jgi:hypothetical protein
MFSSKQVERLREEYAHGATVAELADETGLHTGTMHQVLSGKCYKDVPGAIRKGNRARAAGSYNAKAKVDELQVIEIRQQAKSGLSYKAIARQYGLSDVSVRNIVIGKTWAHIASLDDEEDESNEHANSEACDRGR